MNAIVPVIYEHWRPDTNECFYVGASWVGKNRYEDFSPRNDEYRKVMSFLSDSKIKPYCKIVWENLPEDCVGSYEKMRISYQRAITNNRLTNIMDGGEGFNLSPERNREIQIEIQNRPEINAKRSASLIKANARPEVKARRSAAASAAHAKEGQKEKRKVRESDPELREKRIASAKLGGLAAGKRSKEELSARGKKAAQTRKQNKLLAQKAKTEQKNEQ